MRPRRRMWRATRRLQTRLFLWFLVALGVGIGVMHTMSWFQTRDEPPPAMHTATRTIAARAEREWDDEAALEKYLAHVRDAVGLDLQVRRDVDALPQMPTLKRGVVAFDHKGEAFIPVTRDGQVVGALEFETGHHVPRRPPLFVAFVAVVLVLGVGAGAVARRLAAPLVDVADAAERFGAGDLAARTQVAGTRRRFVADEVRDVAHAFDQMADRIAGVVRDQRELLAAISHELRSPLGRARIALEIARDRSSGPDATKPLDDLERQLGDVDAILGDLLAAARAGLSDAKREPTRIVAWVRMRVASEPTPPTYELICSSIAEDTTVPLDAPLMNRAFHNVLANARGHGHPPDRPIEVHVESDGARVTIAVRDRGPGFPEELLPQAFDPFVKGDAARTPGSGYGLGLALVRRIAEAHGGRARARNVDGGAEVAIELPVV